MPWLTQQPAPSNGGEPKSVRDAYDKTLAQTKEANKKVEAAMVEIDIEIE